MASTGASHFAGVSLPSATMKDMPLWASTVSVHLDSWERTLFSTKASHYPFPWKLIDREWVAKSRHTDLLVHPSRPCAPSRDLPSSSWSQQVCGVPLFEYCGPCYFSIHSFYLCIRSYLCLLSCYDYDSGFVPLVNSLHLLLGKPQKRKTNACSVYLADKKPLNHSVWVKTWINKCMGRWISIIINQTPSWITG